ncbi:hypothetical protein TYRP_005229, partial [Tyrophagus putrescentiae]
KLLDIRNRQINLNVPLNCLRLSSENIEVTELPTFGEQLKILIEASFNENGLNLEQLRQFFVKSPGATQAICKLCYSKILHISQAKNEWTILFQHFSTSQHKTNMDLFLKNKLEYSYTLLDLPFDDYAELIRQSAIREGTFAYTMVYTTTPIRNATAIAEAVRSSLMDRNYRQARTKATAVIKVCLLKVAISHMRSIFETAQSVAIHFDSTTINSKKILVITAKSYIPEKGIVTQIIDLQSVITETADDLAEHIMVAVRNAGINPINVHSLCADNANVNFGVTFNGKILVPYIQGQNAATKLEREMEHSLIDIGCFAHIFNNGYEKGYKAFESFFNMERIVFSTRNSFHQKVQPTEAFKKIAQEEQINLLKLKTLSFTRWASLYNALKIK